MSARQAALAGALLALLALLASGAARAGAPEDEVAALKQAYLACDRAATQRRLATDEVFACSVTAERLLQQGFGGDWERLLAWWRSTRPGPR